MGEQFDLFEWIDQLRKEDVVEASDKLERAIANWSYGVVELENGDLFLAEIYWDDDDRPVAYCEPHLIADPEEGVEGLIKALQNAVLDLTDNPAVIPVSVFHTKED